MASQRKSHKLKKFYYRRAHWEKQEKTTTLEKLLADAHNHLDTVGMRSFTVNSGLEVRGASYKESHGFYLQIASYDPGGPTSIIDKNKVLRESTVSAQNAPDGSDYLVGDVFVFIKDNHVILCTSGVRENVVDIYIRNILKAYGMKGISQTFELDKVAKTDKLKMIRDEGVKGIDLNTSLYEASLLHLDRDNPKISSIKKAVADQITAIFRKDQDLKDIKEKENLNIKISLKFDGQEAMKHSKEPQFGESGRKRLEEAAKQVITDYETEQEDGFVITTRSGNTIKANEIRVSDSFYVEKLGNSLSKNSAWTKLKEYYDRLDGEGVLTQ